MQQRRVLVTGGSGWIGRAVCKRLTETGDIPVVFDRTHDADEDIRDPVAVRVAVRDVEHVIHLAGVLGTHELFGAPEQAVAVNVGGSLNVIQACAEMHVGLTEITMPRVNPSLYAATKACAMDMAEAYRQSGKLSVSHVRAYNAYGTGQAYGGDHPQKIIPTFASRALRNEPIPVWGDGQLLVDLVHVDDVARCLVEASYVGDGQVIDAGTGYAHTVQMVVERVLRLTHSESEVEYLPPRPGERWHPTRADVAQGEGWDLLDGWRPVFDKARFAEAVMSYAP